MNEEYFLVYVNDVGCDSEGINIYEMFFAKDSTVVFGEFWSVLPIGICTKNEKLPHESTIDLKQQIKCKLPLKLAQNNNCLSMMDVTDGILALCWEDISMLEEYPDYRLILHYGEPINEVINKLNNKGVRYEETS